VGRPQRGFELSVLSEQRRSRVVQRLSGLTRRPGRAPTRASESGQLLVETLVAITILVILSTAGIALLASGVLSQSLSRQRTIAEQLALQDIENFRQMPYASVGTKTGDPYNVNILASVPISTVGLNGTLNRQITWVNDPAPGTPYVTKADYKRVTITVVRNDGKLLTTQTTLLSPFNASDYGGPNVGTLNVTIQDMASASVVPGVTVSIAGGPSGSASDVTDVTGVVTFPALKPNPASGPTKCYEITVTPPPGYSVYSKDVPSSCGSSPADAVITAAQTTSTTIRIYKPATVTFNVTRWKLPYTAATTTVNMSATVASTPVTAGPYTVPTTGTLTTGATFLPSSAWTVTATSGALTAIPQTVPIPTLAGYPTSSAATITIGLPDTTITVKKRTTSGCTTAGAGVTVSVSGGPDNLAGLTATTNSSGVATFDLTPGTGYTITSTSTSPVGTTNPASEAVLASPNPTAYTVTYIVSGSGACP